MKSAAILIALLLLAGITAQSAPQAVPPPDPSGLFTGQQVTRGKALYDTKCASCHGMELVADEPEAGDLTGITYRLNWHGKTVADRLEVIRTTMPPGSPMMLTEQEYLDIVVHILHFNGYAVGDRELTPDRNRLEQIVIGPPWQEPAK
jgi:mono/diheme cytochrome c family protein